MFCGLQNGFPNDAKITTDDVECYFVHGFKFDVKTFGFNACFFDVVKSADEAFIVGGVRGDRKILLASNGFGSGTSDGWCFKLSDYTSGQVMMVLNEVFEGNRWLSCSMEFCDSGHAGGKFLKFLRVVY